MDDNMTPFYVALPCVGARHSDSPIINIPSGHIYKVLEDKESGEDESNEDVLSVGWMTLEEAMAKFGEDNVRDGGTSRHCALCADLHFESGDKIISGEINPRSILEKHPYLLRGDFEDYLRI